MRSARPASRALLHPRIPLRARTNDEQVNVPCRIRGQTAPGIEQDVETLATIAERADEHGHAPVTDAERLARRPPLRRPW